MIAIGAWDTQTKGKGSHIFKESTMVHFENEYAVRKLRIEGDRLSVDFLIKTKEEHQGYKTIPIPV